eukprot:1137303-Pelagomonas_calceolata.AAC.1
MPASGSLKIMDFHTCAHPREATQLTQKPGICKSSHCPPQSPQCPAPSVVFHHQGIRESSTEIKFNTHRLCLFLSLQCPAPFVAFHHQEFRTRIKSLYQQPLFPLIPTLSTLCCSPYHSPTTLCHNSSLPQPPTRFNVLWGCQQCS